MILKITRSQLKVQKYFPSSRHVIETDIIIHKNKWFQDLGKFRSVDRGYSSYFDFSINKTKQK